MREDANRLLRRKGWRCQASGSSRRPTTTSGRRPLPIGAFSSMFTGYLRPVDAVHLGYLDRDDPAVGALDAMLSGPDPWCPFFF